MREIEDEKSGLYSCDNLNKTMHPSGIHGSFIEDLAGRRNANKEKIRFSTPFLVVGNLYLPAPCRHLYLFALAKWNTIDGHGESDLHTQCMVRGMAPDGRIDGFIHQQNGRTLGHCGGRSIASRISVVLWCCGSVYWDSGMLGCCGSVYWDPGILWCCVVLRGVRSSGVEHEDNHVDTGGPAARA